MSKEMFPMPEPRPAVRNGEALVEFVQDGEVVGEFNFSRVLKGWWSRLQGTRNEDKRIEVPR